jgi:hypothetical protein
VSRSVGALSRAVGIDPIEIGSVLPPEETLSYLPRSARPGEVRQMIIALSSKWLTERRILRVAYFDYLTQLPNREFPPQAVACAVYAWR